MERAPLEASGRPSTTHHFTGQASLATLPFDVRGFTVSRFFQTLSRQRGAGPRKGGAEGPRCIHEESSSGTCIAVDLELSEPGNPGPPVCEPEPSLGDGRRRN